MDARYFLKERTRMIRYLYDGSSTTFLKTKSLIESEVPPFEPPYSEDGEPAFIEEWIDAETALHLLGLACISLLSDTLKLYFDRLRTTTIGFEFPEGHGPSKKRSFVGCYKQALATIFGDEWQNCPARFDVIEQVVLARNNSQHGSDLTSFHMSHDPRTLKAHPLPFFANEAELEEWAEHGGSPPTTFAPNLTVTRERLFAALDHCEILADWIEDHWGEVTTWRRRGRAALIK